MLKFRFRYEIQKRGIFKIFISHNFLDIFLIMPTKLYTTTNTFIKSLIEYI